MILSELQMQLLESFSKHDVFLEYYLGIPEEDKESDFYKEYSQKLVDLTDFCNNFDKNNIERPMSLLFSNFYYQRVVKEYHDTHKEKIDMIDKSGMIDDHFSTFNTKQWIYTIISSLRVIYGNISEVLTRNNEKPNENELSERNNEIINIIRASKPVKDFIGTRIYDAIYNILSKKYCMPELASIIYNLNETDGSKRDEIRKIMDKLKTNDDLINFSSIPTIKEYEMGVYNENKIAETNEVIEKLIDLLLKELNFIQLFETSILKIEDSLGENVDVVKLEEVFVSRFRLINTILFTYNILIILTEETKVGE